VLRGNHQSEAIALSQRHTLIRLPGMDTDSSHPCGLPLPSEQVWAEFLAALDEMPVDARAVLLLHDVFGAGLDEIVPLVGLHAAACRQRLEQARACLQVHARHLEPKSP
jgi:DNA-directed RNA polymerase specialized sigma24 family protein